MNLLEITEADIKRLISNKVSFGLMETRDKEIMGFLSFLCGKYIFYVFDFDTGTWGKSKDLNFLKHKTYSLPPSFKLPTPTESDIIAYLKASEVSPSRWPKVVQDWAKKHDGELVWEHQTADPESWAWTRFIANPDETLCSCIAHRLRADYGVKKEPEYEDLEVVALDGYYRVKGTGTRILYYYDVIGFIGYVQEDGTVSKDFTDASKVKYVRMCRK